MELPLAAEDKHLVLLSSLQPRLAHLTCVVPQAQLATILTHLEVHLADAVFTLIQNRPSLVEDAKAALPLLRQAEFCCR
jgi:hypothetical protein